MRYEVRCCCDPGKLLGWVDLPRELQLKEWHTFLWVEGGSYLPGESVPAATAHRLRLQLDQWSKAHDPISLFGEGPERLAFRSDDTPIETLRQLREFTEAKNVAR